MIERDMMSRGKSRENIADIYGTGGKSNGFEQVLENDLPLNRRSR